MTTQHIILFVNLIIIGQLLTLIFMRLKIAKKVNNLESEIEELRKRMQDMKHFESEIEALKKKFNSHFTHKG